MVAETRSTDLTGASVAQEIAWPLREHTVPGAMDFAAVYEQHVDRLYRYALHCCGDPALAEEVVAETFRRALEHLPTFQWRGIPIAAWLYRIAHNVLAAHYRHARAMPLTAAREAELAAAAPGPELCVLRAERLREVQAAVAALPLVQRQAIVLHYGENLSLKEIACVLGRSEGAIRQLLHRALVALRGPLASDHTGGMAHHQRRRKANCREELRLVAGRAG